MLCNATDLFYGAAGRQLPSEHVSWITEKQINESLCYNPLGSSPAVIMALLLFLEHWTTHHMSIYGLVAVCAQVLSLLLILRSSYVVK